MAKNTGVLKFQGTIEELTYYRTQDGDIVRKRGGIAKSRILTEASFQRTRENMAEFAQSATAGKIIRRGANTLMQNASDNRVTSRLSQTLSRILKLDTVNARGARSVAEGLSTAQGKALLKGFDFNAKAPLDVALRNKPWIEPLDHSINITGLTPAQQLSYPTGATHVRLQGGMLHVDLDNGVTQMQTSAEQIIAIDHTTATVVLDGFLPSAGTSLVLLLVEFLQDVNGVQYPLGSGYNALGVLDVVEV